VLSGSKELLNYIQDMTGTKKGKIISNGINNKIFKPSNERKAYDIISVGRMIKLKGHSILIDSVNLLKEEFPKVKVLIIGDEGEEYKNLLNQIKKLNLSNNIKLVGLEASRTRENVAKLFNQARIQAHPTIDYESQPISVLEGMSVGLVPVITDVAGVREALGKNYKFIIPRKDTKALYSALRELLKLTKSDFNKITKKIRERSKRFTAPIYTQKLIEVYKEMKK